MNNNYQNIELDVNFQKIVKILANKKLLLFLEEYYQTEISTREENIIIIDSDSKTKSRLEKLFKSIFYIESNNIKLDTKDILYIARMIDEDKSEEVIDLYVHRTKIVANKYKTIYCKTLKQKEYIKAIERNDIIFSIGPAGTGKTYLAVMDAIRRLKNKEVKKIILTRPAVEAGESLGFLPGDLKDKIDPYLQPLYDALYEILGKVIVEEYQNNNIIEIAPLAYMRGRTLDNAIVILDEAQNTSEKQMKMFLTRLGSNSKMIITGDITQVDLPKNTKSGLIIAQDILKNIKGIKIVKFSNYDVIRHPLVKEILARYEKYESRS